MKDIRAMKESSVDILQISVRSSNYLKNLNIKTIGELTSRKNLDSPFIYLSTGESKAALGIIAALETLGLHLDMSEEDWITWSTEPAL